MLFWDSLITITPTCSLCYWRMGPPVTISIINLDFFSGMDHSLGVACRQACSLRVLMYGFSMWMVSMNAQTRFWCHGMKWIISSACKPLWSNTEFGELSTIMARNAREACTVPRRPSPHAFSWLVHCSLQTYCSSSSKTTCFNTYNHHSFLLIRKNFSRLW